MSIIYVIDYYDIMYRFDRDERNWGSFVRDRFVPLFEQYRVDIVVSGHQHNYQRGTRNGVMYAIIGGAGGGLETNRVADWGFYDVTKNVHHYVVLDVFAEHISWRAFTIDGDPLDFVSIPEKK